MFDGITPEKVYYYLFAVGLVMIASYVGNKFKANFVENNDEYEMIRKYLLNDSPLEGYGKPKIWIHSRFEYNARVWESFGSRSSRGLNQPYLHATIQSIIRQCGDDFHICLIDDDSFGKLIPSWDIDLAAVADPMKSYIRNIGMCELLYYYGGLVVPNSFVCLKPLKAVYDDATANGSKPFVCEAINKNANLQKQRGDRRLAFLPSTYFMGAHKNDEAVKDLVQFQKTRIATPHFSSDKDFLGEVEYRCLAMVDDGRMNLLGGELVGVKTAKTRKPVLLDNLMEEEYLDLAPSCLGIYIPADEVLARTKYQWFAVMQLDQIFESSFILSKYMRAAVISGCKEHLPGSVCKSMGI